MRRFVLLALLLCPFVTIGCAGVTKSSAEIARANDRALDMDLRQMTDDWNTLWLADRQYRLTRWYTR